MEALALLGQQLRLRRVQSVGMRFPQFMTEIDGLDIHFIHVKSRHENALPLIITHGWPGSVIEMLNVVGPLTDPTAHGGRAEDTFDVVIPSIPGYGYSGKPIDVGWGPTRIADAWYALMERLGYTKFVAQGGDWGAVIVDLMGVQARPELVGIHTNMPGVVPSELAKGLAPLQAAPAPAGLSAEELHAYEQVSYVYTNGIGYAVEMLLHPQTLYGLADSPVALAAWMLDHEREELRRHRERLRRRTARRQPHARRGPRQHHVHLADQHGRFVGPSLQGKHASASSTSRASRSRSAVSVFPKELYQAPRSWSEAAYPNLIYFNEVEAGNHFAAWQEPQTLLRGDSRRVPVASLEEIETSAGRAAGAPHSEALGRPRRFSFGRCNHEREPTLLPLPTSGGRPNAGVRRRDRLVELEAADTDRPARQGRRRPVLDVHVHQLAPDAAVHPGVGRHVRRERARRGRRAHARVRRRARHRQRAPRRAASAASSIRSRSTTTTPCGAHSPTSTGRRSTSPTRKGASATITSAKADTNDPSRSSGTCSPTPARRLFRPSRRASMSRGIELAADGHNLRSPETYVGLARSEGFAALGDAAIDEPREYTLPARLRVNEWALAGDWTLGREAAVSNERERPHRVPLPRA